MGLDGDRTTTPDRSHVSKQPVADAASPAFADTLPQVVWMANADGRVTYFNRRWYEYTGLAEEESLGLEFIHAVHPADQERVRVRWERAWRNGEPYEAEYRLYSRDLATYRWFLARADAVRDVSGAVVQWSGTCTDIDAQKRFEEEVRRHAAELKASRAELARLARHDTLTGLPNRVLFEDRLRQALATAERHGRLVAVVFIDLDGFKRVNDTLGHQAGDTLLQQVSARLQGAVRGSDTVARLGGDEFVVLASELDEPEDAMALARKLLVRVGEPYDIAGQRIRLTGSLGVSLYPDDAETATTLLRHADVAMYRAKQGGKNDARFFARGMNDAAHERMQIAAHLDGALERGEMRLEFQPQWGVDAELPQSFEALLRWENPILGSVDPDRFIPIAEDNGVILDVCSWVLDETCSRAVAWSQAAGRALRVAMNVSLVQLDRRDFVPLVADTLSRHGLDPRQLELELSARLGIHDLAVARAQLAELKALGVRLTMDGFGTPGSSIDHVLRLPLHALKIDQGVIQHVDTSGAAASDASSGGSGHRVLEALVGLAKALDLDVVASGIETESQRRHAIDLGCSRLQGFLLSAPMSAEAAAALVASWSRLARTGD
jgi:diguanylate cyclase